KARELSLEFGIPYCFTAHGYDIHRKPPSDFYDRALAAGAVITVSESNANYISQTFGVPKSHINIIPCGVDTSVFSPVPTHDKQSEQALIVCIARLVEVKNLNLLLHACAVLRSRSVPFHCVLAGDGPLRSPLLQRRRSLDLDDVVEMPGAVDQSQVLHYWQRASLGVLTSDNEGMPLCLMEAAACGVPVVATAVGGVPELVQNGVTGILCRRGDPKDIADALELLITDRELNTKMRCAARHRAEQQFSVQRQVNELQRVWAQALQQVPV
ncbi:MAG TPA: glycosyltransferase family 4 protein, partial [Candidatus Dormibacteraeota bacterium]|nr:glycosyltransferase family 4 protein [Candidatus Dormibacteraeota bacterium]